MQKGGKVRFSRVFNTLNLSSSCMPHLNCFIFTALLLWVPWSDSCAEVSAADTTQFDVVYKSTEQGPVKLDLHYPATPKPGVKFPLVLFTHGGGWAAGTKTIGDRGVRFMGVKALNEQGFCVASVEYRLCTPDGRITVRDCVTDAKDALRFLAKHAARFSIDAEQVFTWGDSAGGHLAQMLLLSAPETFSGDPALLDAKYRLIAGVSWYGPCDFERMDLFTPPGGTGVRDRFGARILKPGADEKARLAAYREVSPLNYLRSDSAPLLMMQGDNDPTIPVQHAHYMKERGDAVKAPVEVFIVKNSGHNWREVGGPLSPALDEVMNKTAAFMKLHLE
jgi:acetyl esterase/lipase